MIKGNRPEEIATLKLHKKRVFDNRKNSQVDEAFDIKNIRKFQREGALSGCLLV
jgi:hypothetical protein